MSDNVRALIAELRRGDGNGCKGPNDVMRRAADALESQVRVATHAADRVIELAVERDSLAATIERARGLLGELDLDSGPETAPGTAWGSILREARDALDSAPPVSDDTEWEYGIQHKMASGGVTPILDGMDEETGRACLVNSPNATLLRRKAGPWVAIEKGGESNG